MNYTLHTNEWTWGISINVISENAIAIARISIANETKENAWIEGVSVLPNYRHKGYATNLLKYCENICKQHGVKRIDLDSEAYCSSLYEKIGYIKIQETESGLIEMYKDI